MEWRHMPKLRSWSVVVVTAVFGLTAGSMPAQAQKATDSIVCWKDKGGKVIGCGDKVPPEYLDNASKVINQRGVTVKQTDSALTNEQKQAQAADAEQKKIDAQKRELEKRRDRALLDSFSNEKEIDLKRTRDIQQIEVNIAAQQTNLKNVNDRQHEVRTKIGQLKKENKPVGAPMQEEFDRMENEKSKIQAQILQKRKEIVERNAEYDAMKKRFMELKGIAAVPATAAVVPAVAAGTPKK
jgi:peptidoglycan hydrolase CwlO-like protein